MKLVDKAALIESTLATLYPTPAIPLDHASPFQLLVAVILSAQTTDKKVNEVTPDLFHLAPDAQTMAKLSVPVIEKAIRQIGLAPTKAKNLSKMSQALVAEHDGQVPSSFLELEKLAGVGHKTASVVMCQAFGHAAFPVDTHIHRLAQRWGLTCGRSVEKTEADLKALFQEESWRMLHLRIIYFGREHCPAQRHDPSVCPICSWAAVPPYDRPGASPFKPGQRPPNSPNGTTTTPTTPAKAVRARSTPYNRVAKDLAAAAAAADADAVEYKPSRKASAGRPAAVKPTAKSTAKSAAVKLTTVSAAVDMTGAAAARRGRQAAANSILNPATVNSLAASSLNSPITSPAFDSNINAAAVKITGAVVAAATAKPAAGRMRKTGSPVDSSGLASPTVTSGGIMSVGTGGREVKRSRQRSRKRSPAEGVEGMGSTAAVPGHGTGADAGTCTDAGSGPGAGAGPGPGTSAVAIGTTQEGLGVVVQHVAKRRRARDNVDMHAGQEVELHTGKELSMHTGQGIGMHTGEEIGMHATGEETMICVVGKQGGVFVTQAVGQQGAQRGARGGTRGKRKGPYCIDEQGDESALLKAANATRVEGVFDRYQAGDWQGRGHGRVSRLFKTDSME